MTRVAVAAVATLAAATVWGTSFVANAFGLRTTGALAFTAARFALAALSAWLVLLALDRKEALAPPWRGGAWWAFGALTAAAFALQYFGQERTTPARAALFVNANVFTVALLQLRLHRERPPGGMLVAAAVAVVGVVLLTGGARGGLAGGSVLGDALAFAGGATWAYYIVATKRWLVGRSALATVTWTFVATALVLAPLALLVPGGGVPGDAVAWAAVLWTGIACSTLAYLLWMRGLRGLSPTASSVLLLVEVPVAAAISVAVGLDRFGLLEALGALLLFGGVAWASVLEARQEARLAGPKAT